MIEVLAGGTLSTLQDLGRTGQSEYGMGCAGAMDRWAARIANVLVNNAQNAPLIEMTLAGPELLLHQPTWCAVTGADFTATRNEQPLPPHRPVWLDSGARLRFRSPRSGCRAFMAVASGFSADKIFNSVATDIRAGIGGIEGRPLRRGDRLRYQAATTPSPHDADWSSALVPAAAADATPLALIPGPALAQLSVADRELLWHQCFVVGAEADRMGIRLNGAMPSASRLPSMISQAVVFGSVQLPPDGRPIILGADHQTTGGYPLLGVVAGVDHTRIAQLRAGDPVRFRCVTVEQAQSQWREREQRFQRWRLGVAAWWKERGG